MLANANGTTVAIWNRRNNSERSASMERSVDGRLLRRRLCDQVPRGGREVVEHQRPRGKRSAFERGESLAGPHQDRRAARGGAGLEVAVRVADHRRAPELDVEALG